MSTIAILLCAGKGERLGAGIDKAQAPLAGRALFTWSLAALERCDAVHGIVMVGPARALQPLIAAAGLTPRKIVAWTDGGRERQQSVARGLAALPADCTHVAVHDAARALATPALIAHVIGDALQHGAAIAAVPLADTLKRVSLAVIDTTVPRQGLWCAQTPQVFRRDWLEAAHVAATAVATDDAALVEALGHPVRVSAGEPLNFKVTTAQDLALAEAWLLRVATES